MKQTTTYVGVDLHWAATVAVVGDDTGHVIDWAAKPVLRLE
jgi:hypothetical protein